MEQWLDPAWPGGREASCDRPNYTSEDAERVLSQIPNLQLDSDGEGENDLYPGVKKQRSPEAAFGVVNRGAEHFAQAVGDYGGEWEKVKKRKRHPSLWYPQIKDTEFAPVFLEGLDRFAGFYERATELACEWSASSSSFCPD